MMRGMTTLVLALVMAPLVAGPGYMLWRAKRTPVHIVQGIAFPLPDDPRWEEQDGALEIGPVRVRVRYGWDEPNTYPLLVGGDLIAEDARRYGRAVWAAHTLRERKAKLARAAEAIAEHDRKLLEG